MSVLVRLSLSIPLWRFLLLSILFELSLSLLTGWGYRFSSGSTIDSALALTIDSVELVQTLSLDVNAAETLDLAVDLALAFDLSSGFYRRCCFGHGSCRRCRFGLWLLPSLPI